MRLLVWIGSAAVSFAAGWVAVKRAGLGVGWGVAVGVGLWILLGLQALAARLRRLGELRMPTLEDAMRKVEKHPNSAEAHNLLGQALEAEGEIEEAEREFRRAMELDPKLPGVYLNLAMMLRQYGKTEDAVPVLRRGIEQCDHEFAVDIMQQLIERFEEPPEG